MPAILPINTATQAGQAGPVAPTNELGQDAFLKLLVTQLQYQDPLEPTDPGQFLAQTAQFTTVETLQKISDQNIAQSESSSMTAASSLIGREVTYINGAGELLTGVVSAAQFTADGTSVKVGSGYAKLDQIVEVSMTEEASS